jgi:hypothetical protein
LRLERGRYVIVAKGAQGAASAHVVVADEPGGARRSGFTVTR